MSLRYRVRPSGGCADPPSSIKNGYMGAPRTASVTAIVVSAVLAGCSFIGVAPPPDTPERQCTEGSALPGLDAIFGVVLSIGGTVVAVGASVSSGCSDCGGIRDTIRDAGLVALGVGVLYGASSISGFIRTSKCREYHQARRPEPRSPLPAVTSKEASDE